MTAKQRHLSLIDYLGHIEEAATLASDYVRNMPRDMFLSDRKTQQAVIYRREWRL